MCMNYSFVCYPVIYLFMYSHSLFHKTFEQHIGSAVWILSWNLEKWFHCGMLFGRSCQAAQWRREQFYAAVLWQWCQMPTRKLKHLVAWIKIFSFQQIPVAWTDIISMESLCLFVLSPGIYECRYVRPSWQASDLNQCSLSWPLSKIIRPFLQKS